MQCAIKTSCVLHFFVACGGPLAVTCKFCKASLPSLQALWTRPSWKKVCSPHVRGWRSKKICTSGLATSLKRCSPQSERTTMCQPAHGTTAHDNAWVSQRGCTYELEKPTCRSVSWAPAVSRWRCAGGLLHTAALCVCWPLRLNTFEDCTCKWVCH